MTSNINTSRRAALAGVASAAFSIAARAAPPPSPQAAGHVSFIVYLPTRPLMKERMRQMMLEVVDTMSREPDFVSTWVHEDLNDPDVLINYETWACSREYFVEHHLGKPYRQAYEAALPDMLSAERRIVFLKMLRAYPGRPAAT